MSPISKRILIPFVLLPVLAGSVLRLWRTEHQAMSPEEAITWHIAVQPSLTETVHFANHWKDGWIFHVLLHVWVNVFGDGPESVRGFSAACGTTTILLVGLLTGSFANAVHSPRAPNEVCNLNTSGSAILGICLIGSLGSHLQMSRSVSPAVLGCLFVVLGTLFLVRVFAYRRSPTKWKLRYLYWAGYAATIACVLFTKPFFLVLYIAHIPYILICFYFRCDDGNHDGTLVPQPRYRLRGKRLATILILLYCGPFLLLATTTMAQTRSIDSTHIKQLGEQWSQAVLARDVLRWGPEWLTAGLCVVTAAVFLWMTTQRREYALLTGGQAAVGIAACFCLTKADDMQAIQELQYAVLATSVTIVFSLIPALITRQFGLIESLILCVFLITNNLVPFFNWIDRISDNETLSGMRGVISHIRDSQNASIDGVRPCFQLWVQNWGQVLTYNLGASQGSELTFGFRRQEQKRTCNAILALERSTTVGRGKGEQGKAARGRVGSDLVFGFRGHATGTGLIPKPSPTKQVKRSHPSTRSAIASTRSAIASRRSTTQPVGVLR